MKGSLQNHAYSHEPGFGWELHWVKSSPCLVRRHTIILTPMFRCLAGNSC